jgi:hypothetical protein
MPSVPSVRVPRAEGTDNVANAHRAGLKACSTKDGQPRLYSAMRSKPVLIEYYRPVSTDEHSILKVPAHGARKNHLFQITALLNQARNCVTV